jgi:NAD(P)-dependent dehydrogenase (short-subunit alcohol dehydrogenase family)
MTLRDEVAIVTGGGRGLGRAFALGLAREGARVVVGSRTQSRLDQAVSEISSIGGRALAVVVNLAEESSVQNLVEETLKEFGRIDILVNNAGILAPFRNVVDMPTREWDLTQTINLRGTFLCCKSVLPHMISRRKGKIINIGAGVSDERVHVGLSAYCASKAGVINFTRQLAAEVREFGILVNCLDPGAVRTSMAEQLEASDDTREWLLRQQTVDPDAIRFRHTDEIVPLLLFLASEQSSALNGRFLQVTSKGSPKYLQL